MNEFIINAGQIEELQVIKDMTELDNVFSKAKSAVVQGGIVIINRENVDGSNYTVEEISTEDDLRIYRETVYKYL